MPQPRITVLMPVYNGEKYLREAIGSVLNQTFRDFELLIIDDGSTDGTQEIASRFGDSRIRLEKNDINLGLIATLNRGLDLAQGEFIARMDCDDISFPERFARQVEFLDRHPDIGICGTWYKKISSHKTITIRAPVGHGTIRFLLLFDNPFLHSTMVMRRSVLKNRGLRFDPRYRHAEDYDFWARVSESTRTANIPEVLLSYRSHSDSISHRFKNDQGAAADRVRYRQLINLGLAATKAEIELHNALAKFEFSAGRRGLEHAKAWLERLIELGCRRYGIPKKLSYQYVARYWYGACGKYSEEGLGIWRVFRSSPVGRAAEWEWQWKLFLRCALRKSIVEPAAVAQP